MTQPEITYTPVPVSNPIFIPEHSKKLPTTVNTTSTLTLPHVAKIHELDGSIVRGYKWLQNYDTAIQAKVWTEEMKANFFSTYSKVSSLLVPK